MCSNATKYTHIPEIYLNNCCYLLHTQLCNATTGNEIKVKRLSIFLIDHPKSIKFSP